MNLVRSNKRDAPEGRLLELFKALPEAEQRSALDYLEFLAARCPPREQVVPEPEPIPRPEGESVIKAMRRLSASYHMLDKAKMLNETSALMAQHVMQGRPAEEVIDELEVVFEAHYRRLVGDSEE